VILPTEDVASLDWSPDGTRIAYSTWLGEASILRLRRGRGDAANADPSPPVPPGGCHRL